MDGFKDTTKTHYVTGGAVRGAAKVSKVMHEFKSGTLHSGAKDGPAVTNRKQGIAIALSEAAKSAKGMKRGGMAKKASAAPMQKLAQAIASQQAGALQQGGALQQAANLQAAGGGAPSSVPPQMPMPGPQGPPPQGFARGGAVKKSPSSSTDVRSPTSTSTKAYTAGNVTVTGGAGDGDTTVHVHPRQPGPVKKMAKGGAVIGAKPSLKVPVLNIKDPEGRALDFVNGQTLRKSDRYAEDAPSPRKSVPVAPTAPLIGAKRGGAITLHGKKW